MTLVRHLLALSLLAMSGWAWAADEELIRAQVAQLDDDQFARREAAKVALLKIGEPAIAQLTVALENGSAEQRAKATTILRSIRLGTIARGFRELGRQEDDALDVEVGMVLIAQILDPGVTPKSIDAKLDEMAAAVRKSVGKGVEPKSLSGEEIIAALTGVLKGEHQLEGDTENYDHPDNSSIHRVLEQKNGLPILLSEIAVAVGRRLDVPLVGVPVPGRYMFKYDGTQAPKGKPKKDVIVDPYGGWDVLPADEIAFGRRFFDPRQDLMAAKPRATMERMLNNLESDLEVIGEPRQATMVRRFRAMLVPTR